MDTCHTHVAGYDIVTPTATTTTLAQIDGTIGLKNVSVWHCNDAKADRGSKLDRHQHIGKGTIGARLSAACSTIRAWRTQPSSRKLRLTSRWTT